MHNQLSFPSRTVSRLNGCVAPLVFLCFSGLACSDEKSNARTAEDADASSGTDAATSEDASAGTSDAPDYAAAFPQDRVGRLDITITPADWQAMVDDMTDMLGAFGEGGSIGGPGMQPGQDGGPGGGLPPELTEACAELTAGAACSATFMGMESAGTCTEVGADLACIPEGGPGGGFPGGPGAADGGVPGGGMGGGGLSLLARTPLYVECQVSAGERAWEHVGIRFKGNSSLATPWSQGVWKLPLRLNFDRFEDEHPESKNQRFFGFESLSLSNGALDPSLLRDKLGTEVFAKAGIPAAATAFYRVFIDHGDGPTYFGLYTATELPSDESFMDTHFEGHDGNLYKPDGTGATWASWDEESLGKENHEKEADYSDARALFDALHADRTGAAAFRTGLEAALDVDGFLHWLALNTVVGDWDHYGRMSHNYYMYAHPDQGGKLYWITWDHSFAFSTGSGIGGGSLSLALSEVGEDWPLINFLVADPVYRSTYEAYLAQAVASEYTVAAYTERFRAAHELISPYVLGEEGEREGYTFTSRATFEASLDELIEHVTKRKADVAAHLE